MQMHEQESLTRARCAAKKTIDKLLYEVRSLNVRKQSSCARLVYIHHIRTGDRAYHREDCGKHFDHLTQVSDLVVPVKHHTGLANHEHEVGLCICLAQTVVWASTKYEPVLGLLISSTGDPSLGFERVGVRICFSIMQRHVGCGNDHGALRDSVIGSDGEVLLCEVRNHDDWRAVAESLFDNGAGPLKLFYRIERQRSVDVTIPSLDVLFADFLEELWSVSHDLEQPCSGRRGSVLGGEEEGEDSHGDFEVAEPANDSRWLLGIVNLLASLDPLAVLLRLNHVVHPEVKNAVLLATSRHADLGLCGALGEFHKNHVGGLLSVPALGKGQDDGEVDKLKRSSNQVVVVGDLLHGLFGAVVANESPAAHSGDQLAELLHPWNVLALVLDLGELHPAFEVVVVDLLLAWQVLLECLAGEEAVEALAVVYVCAAVEEDPVLGTKELVCRIDDARLDEVGRVEDLARHVASGGDNNKSTLLSIRCFCEAAV
jgi:hypothetical protein